jgi:hypothetical protein
MNEEKGFSLSLKVIIVVVLLVLILVAGIIYSSRIDKQPVVKRGSIEQSQNKKEIVNYDELVRSYKESLVEVIDEFNGDYQSLQEQIVEIAVPSGFQEVHLQLVLALNHVLYEDNSGITKNKLQKIADSNDWLAKSLNKVILNLI